MTRTRLLVVACLFTSAGVCGALACGGSSGNSIGGGGADGGDAGEGGGPSTDASTDGGTAVTDGGDNIDTDGGNVDEAGTDAGKCNAIAQAGAAISSTCTSLIPNFGGGALVAGKYTLVAVTDLGTQGFCNTKFVPVGFRGTLDLAVSGATATAETVTDIGTTARERRTATFTTKATNTSPMTGEDTCPTMTAPTSLPYTSAVVSGKQQLDLLLPYGTGEAVYTYSE